MRVTLENRGALYGCQAGANAEPRCEKWEGGGLHLELSAMKRFVLCDEHRSAVVLKHGRKTACY